MYRISERLPSRSLQQGVCFLSKNKCAKVLQRNPHRYYSEGGSRKRSILLRPATYVIVTSIAAGSALAYARVSPGFRKKLDEYVPGTDGFIKFVYQEEKSYFESITDSISNTSTSALNSLYRLIGFGNKTEESKPLPDSIPSALRKPTKPQPESSPKQESTPLVAKSEKGTTKPETRPSETGAKVEPSPKAKTVEKVDSRKSQKVESLQKYNLPELEKSTVDAAKTAIITFTSALNDLKEYREEVSALIEKSVKNEDQSVWFKIQHKTEEKNKCIEKANVLAANAMKKIEHLKLLISDKKTDVDENLKAQIEENVKNVLNDLIYTKAVFTKELNNASVTEKYAKKVEESRQSLSKELGILFPSLIIDSDLVVTEEELDLFVLYTNQLLNFYQKELQKLETVGQETLSKIVEQSKAGSPEVLQGILEVESEKLKRNFTQELLKTELKLKLDFENELKTILRRQTEVHSDHLQEVIHLKDKETERKLKQNIEEKVEDMKIRYNRQLARIIGRMKGLDVALKEKAIAEKQAKRSQLLWNACQALILAIKSGTNVKSWEEQLKPLQDEISAIAKAAAKEDPLVEAVIASIPGEALSRGVFSELALKDRFLNVEKVAYKLANLPEGFVSLPKVFLSYLQSYLLVNLSTTIPPTELANEPFDASALTNYDVLFRARYWLDRGDFQQTLKYMNLLKGASRAIANEWINEARILLETQQAANLLLSHAVYSNLLYLSNSS